MLLNRRDWLFTMNDELKKLGIIFQEPVLVEEYYARLKGILVTGVGGNVLNGMVLDLNALPTKPIDLKAAVIKWLVSVNLPRLKKGKDAITDISLIMKCPIWKVVKPPFRKIQLTPKGMINKPSVTTVGQKSIPGQINKK